MSPEREVATMVFMNREAFRPEQQQQQAAAACVRRATMADCQTSCSCMAAIVLQKRIGRSARVVIY